MERKRGNCTTIDALFRNARMEEIVWKGERQEKRQRKKHGAALWTTWPYVEGWKEDACSLVDASVSFSFFGSLTFICYFTNNNYKDVCLKNCKPWAINNENMQICDWQNYSITTKIQCALQLKRKYLNKSNFAKYYFISTHFQSLSKKWAMNRVNHTWQPCQHS